MGNTSNTTYQLAYLSQVRFEMNQVELAELLTECRKANQQFKITGFLIYHHRIFFQLIEGSKDAIDQLYKNLLVDRRHMNLQRVLYSKVKQRRFSDWSMAYLQYSHFDNALLDGFNRTLKSYLNQFDQDIFEFATPNSGTTVEQFIDKIQKYCKQEFKAGDS